LRLILRAGLIPPGHDLFVLRLGQIYASLNELRSDHSSLREKQNGHDLETTWDHSKMLEPEQCQFVTHRSPVAGGSRDRLMRRKFGGPGSSKELGCRIWV